MSALSASIVVNTFNRARALERLLPSLERLDTACEVVVVNGPSTDDTEEVLARFAGRIKVARCPEPNLSRSRNIGIAAAAGDVVVFIDDDALPADTAWLTRCWPRSTPAAASARRAGRRCTAMATGRSSPGGGRPTTPSSGSAASPVRPVTAGPGAPSGTTAPSAGRRWSPWGDSTSTSRTTSTKPTSASGSRAPAMTSSTFRTPPSVTIRRRLRSARRSSGTGG
ncbi:MAG: glycosyltransferase family 2 protein [Vicinamibacterales bacterium]